MRDSSKVFDDMAKVMTNAAGVAQGVRAEADAFMRGRMERWFTDMDLVTREEFDAIREMAVLAREENAQLRAEIEELKQRINTNSASEI